MNFEIPLKRSVFLCYSIPHPFFFCYSLNFSYQSNSFHYCPKQCYSKQYFYQKFYKTIKTKNDLKNNIKKQYEKIIQFFRSETSYTYRYVMTELMFFFPEQSAMMAEFFETLHRNNTNFFPNISIKYP